MTDLEKAIHELVAIRTVLKVLEIQHERLKERVSDFSDTIDELVKNRPKDKPDHGSWT